jgi:hypothetical protein
MQQMSLAAAQTSKEARNKNPAALVEALRDIYFDVFANATVQEGERWAALIASDIFIVDMKPLDELRQDLMKIRLSYATDEDGEMQARSESLNMGCNWVKEEALGILLSKLDGRLKRYLGILKLLQRLIARFGTHERRKKKPSIWNSMTNMMSNNVKVMMRERFNYLRAQRVDPVPTRDYLEEPEQEIESCRANHRRGHHVHVHGLGHQDEVEENMRETIPKLFVAHKESKTFKPTRSRPNLRQQSVVGQVIRKTPTPSTPVQTRKIIIPDLHPEEVDLRSIPQFTVRRCT